MKRLLYNILSELDLILLLKGKYFELRYEYFLKRLRETNWRNRFFKWFRATGIIVVIGMFIVYGYRVDAIGFGNYTDSQGNFHGYKTLWDWLDLLIVPLLLAYAAYNFTKSQREKDIAISASNREEEAFQMYLDKMTELLLAPNLGRRKAGVAKIARARTLTVLEMLSGKLKGRVLRFLLENDLLKGKNPFVNLESANFIGLETLEVGGSFKNIKINHVFLTNAKLFGIVFWTSDFVGVTFEKSDLQKVSFIESTLDYASFAGAKMEGIGFGECHLYKANFSNAQLQQAVLRNAILDRSNMQSSNLAQANLAGASLVSADLSFTILRDADFSDADFTNTNLFGANLKGTNLSRAKLAQSNITKKQVRQARSIEGATLPWD